MFCRRAIAMIAPEAAEHNHRRMTTITLAPTLASSLWARGVLIFGVTKTEPVNEKTNLPYVGLMCGHMCGGVQTWKGIVLGALHCRAPAGGILLPCIFGIVRNAGSGRSVTVQSPQPFSRPLQVRDHRVWAPGKEARCDNLPILFRSRARRHLLVLPSTCEAPVGCECAVFEEARCLTQLRDRGMHSVARKPSHCCILAGPQAPAHCPDAGRARSPQRTNISAGRSALGCAASTKDFANGVRTPFERSAGLALASIGVAWAMVACLGPSRGRRAAQELAASGG